MTIHILATHGAPTREHYDRTQTDDTIRDGDVMIIGGTIAVMDGAWPVAVVGPHGQFHQYNEGMIPDRLERSIALIRIIEENGY